LRQRARGQDRNPSKPRLQKTGLATRLETEMKSRESITDNKTRTTVLYPVHKF